MTHKHGYFIQLAQKGITGTGECSYIEGLSIDFLTGYTAMLDAVVEHIDQITDDYYAKGVLPAEILMRFPSIAFGLETALLDLAHGGRHEIIKESAFFKGQEDIPINGLVWMGTDAFMKQQIEQKLTEGFKCIKIKVGAIDFSEECRLIEGIRKEYGSDQIEIRLDANGGFNEKNVRERLRTLAQYDIHSIEQPVKPQQYLLMRQLCAENIIPIALDEELIGTDDKNIKAKLLEMILPQYIILKPSLLGGFGACEEWIDIATSMRIDWWATSALESNIGLNAIAQWVADLSHRITMKGRGGVTVQGLGTGSLYTNNVPSPLFIADGHLKYAVKGEWGEMR
jgi:o-succinylbenzoate synthase